MERRKTTHAIFDLDHTVTAIDTYPAFLAYVLRRRKSRWAASLSLPVAYGLFAVGLRDNNWLKETFLRVVCGGMRVDELQPLVAGFVRHVADSKLRPGATDNLSLHKDAGHRTMLATASPDIYVYELAKQIGFDQTVCTLTERGSDGRLTGRLMGANCRGREKLSRVIASLQADRADVQIVAYSDHEADLPLLEWADVGCAVNPTRRLRRQAVTKGILTLDWSGREGGNANWNAISLEKREEP
jgi:HAD superfamily hydrolase (TIGR01490 family)